MPSDRQRRITPVQVSRGSIQIVRGPSAILRGPNVPAPFGQTTQRFFVEGERHEASDWQDTVLPPDGEPEPRVKAGSFDKVPRQKGAIVTLAVFAACFIAGVAFGVRALWRTGWSVQKSAAAFAKNFGMVRSEPAPPTPPAPAVNPAPAPVPPATAPVPAPAPVLAPPAAAESPAAGEAAPTAIPVAPAPPAAARGLGPLPVVTPDEETDHTARAGRPPAAAEQVPAASSDEKAPTAIGAPASRTRAGASSAKASGKVLGLRRRPAKAPRHPAAQPPQEKRAADTPALDSALDHAASPSSTGELVPPRLREPSIAPANTGAPAKEKAPPQVEDETADPFQP